MRLHRPISKRRVSRLFTVFAALATLALADAATALAESCVYDGTAKSLTATISPGSTAALKVVGGELHFGPAASIAACGAATTTNTDTISVTGASGSTEKLILDQRGGFFGPGAEAESNQPEIEMDIVMGDLSDSIVIYGTEGDDHMAPGQNGIALDSDGDTGSAASTTSTGAARAAPASATSARWSSPAARAATSSSAAARATTSSTAAPGTT
jgi:hypothetical protein